MNLQNNTLPADHFVNVHGYKTRYWDVGFSNSVVILVHGFGLSCEIWQQNIEELAKQHRVIALDFLGSGKTDATPNKVNIQDYPEFLIWFMDALKIKKAKLIGHSLGGLIVMRVAHDYPEYVEKFMLVGSAGFTQFVPWYFRFSTIPGVGEFLLKSDRKRLKHALSQNMYRGTVSDELVDCLFEYSKKPFATKQALNVVRSGMTVFGFRPSVLGRVKRETKSVHCPVFVIWGKNDRILHYRGAFRAKKLLPQAQVKIFEKCGHLPQMEYAREFNELSNAFL